MSKPKAYMAFKKQQPDLVAAYEALGEACTAAGPLDAKTTALIKLGIALGSGLEGGSHSAARKALDAGATPDEILHAVYLATTTLGFPTMMRARSWVMDVLEKGGK